MASGFDRLERRIEREYREKGVGKERASYIAHAAAGKVAREKRGNPSRRKCSRCGQYGHDLRRHGA